MKPAIIAIAAFILAAWAIIVYAAITLQIPTTGEINIPNSPALQASPSTINWGTLKPSQTVTRQVTLTNTGTASTGALTMTATPTVGTLTWNQQGNVIPAGGSLTTTFTLTTSTNPPAGPFSFNITITG